MEKKNQRKTTGQDQGEDQKKKDAGMEAQSPESDTERREALGRSGTIGEEGGGEGRKSSQEETPGVKRQHDEEERSSGRDFDEKTRRGDQPGYGAGAP